MNAAQEHEAAKTMNVTVGQGITVCIGGDRYPATIVWVSESGKTFRFQDDDCRGDVFVLNPKARVRTAYRNKQGDWCVQGSRSYYIHVGGREARLDPSF